MGEGGASEPATAELAVVFRYFAGVGAGGGGGGEFLYFLFYLPARHYKLGGLDAKRPFILGKSSSLPEDEFEPGCAR